MSRIIFKYFTLLFLVFLLILFSLIFSSVLTSCVNFKINSAGPASNSSINENSYPNSENASDNNEIANEEKENDKDESATQNLLDSKKVTICISKFIPNFISAIIKRDAKNLFENVLFVDGYENVNEMDKTDELIYVDIMKSNSSVDANNFIIICPVTNFYNSKDEIKISDIEMILKNEAQSQPQNNLYVSQEISGIFKKFYGQFENDNIKVLDTNSIVQNIKNNPQDIALIPFDSLRKELKVLNIASSDVDSNSVFSTDFSYLNYPLSFSVSFSGNNSENTSMLKDKFEESFYSNRDPEKLTVVNMTGVTALVRGVANRMDKKGVTYPAEKIADVLRDGNITHISNEISFKENCNAGQSGTIFCSKPSYIELLKFIGTDVVELTGNHLNDYGPQFLVNTIKMYDKEGFKYFGGGLNVNLAKHPALFDINGNKIAFIGFNQFGPSYDWATNTDAGSAPPDKPFYISEIKRLKENGYNVIFTFQYEESYNYFPLKSQINDFREMSDAGATIVSGSQAHQPMGFELKNNGLICYGLGNLFFDQMQSIGTRQGLIAKHVFYNNRYIGTQFIPTIIEDYCQPRLMNLEEKANFLEIIYNSSINITKTDGDNANT